MTDTATATTTPADEPTPEEIAAASTIRPLHELPSNWTVKGNPTILAPDIRALSPTDQDTVRQRAGSSDPEAINAALMGFLRERSADARIRTGAGEGATETERVALEQMGTVRRLTEEAARIEAELADVVYHETRHVDGKPVAVPVYRYTHDARRLREARLDDIRGNMVAVYGIEGSLELEEAARADALRTRELNRQLAEEAEAKATAAKTVRDERVKKRADAYAKHLRAHDNINW